MKPHASELIRYGINGVFATAVHFGALYANINWLGIQSAGLANLLAAILGISFSFLGSRYFVYKNQADTIWRQAIRFASLYAGIACIHGALLWAWTDWQHQDYRAGFLIATAAQISLSYFGNKFLVFKA
jgi:putative flippase GtrA